MTSPDCSNCNCPKMECLDGIIDGKIKIAVLEVENSMQAKVASRRGVAWSYILGGAGIVLAVINSVLLYLK